MDFRKIFLLISKIIKSKYTYYFTRNILGFIFLYAGIIKILDPKSFAKIISHYDLVPEGLLKPVAIGLPLIEILAGIGLILNIRGSLTVIFSLLVMFMIILYYGILRDLNIDCGCFTTEEIKGINTLRSAFYRDIFMMIGVFYLYIYKRMKNDKGATPNIIFNRIKEDLR